jgi:hypothetical protein
VLKRVFDRFDIPAVVIVAFLAVGLSCGGPDSNSETSQTIMTVAPQSHTNVLTYHNDAGRTGQNSTEVTLTLANVKTSSFGKLFSLSVDGKVDAQPLYVSQLSMPGRGVQSVAYTATEHDSIYAFDAGSGALFWRTTLLGTGETPSDDRGCGQAVPEIGVTATPVIDLTAGLHGIIYALAMSKDAAGVYHHRLHALDLTTGEEQLGAPVEISANFPGSGDNSSNGQVIFDAKQYKSRPGLLLLNGVVYTGWGSHCDIRPYTGWLLAYDHSTLQQVGVFNFAPNGSAAALWNSGGGIAADAATGRLFVSVANGTFDTALDNGGFPGKGDFGNAFVKMNLLGGKLTAEDYWTMNNTVTESSQDQDLGSGGVLLLPDLTNASGQVVQLGTGAGKDGNLYVFNRGNMGKFDTQGNGTLYQQIPGALGGPEFASPAWFNGTVYYGASADRIRALSVNAALVQGQPTSATDQVFAYPGVAPAISANGTTNGILWVVENASQAVLHAYDATNLANEIYNTDQAAAGRDGFGAGNKYITPTIADGRVIVGGPGAVTVFGLMN